MLEVAAIAVPANWRRRRERSSWIVRDGTRNWSPRPWSSNTLRELRPVSRSGAFASSSSNALPKTPTNKVMKHVLRAQPFCHHTWDRLETPRGPEPESCGRLFLFDLKRKDRLVTRGWRMHRPECRLAAHQLGRYRTSSPAGTTTRRNFEQTALRIDESASSPPSTPSTLPRPNRCVRHGPGGPSSACGHLDVLIVRHAGVNVLRPS